MSRNKREAADSIAELRDYLARDRHAMQLLDAISRYTVTLRKSKKELADKLTQVTAEAQALRTRCEHAERSIAVSQDALSAERSMRMQSQSEAASAKRSLDELHRELMPRLDSPLTVGESQLWDTFRSLVSAKRKAPRPATIYTRPNGDKCYMFCIDDIISDISPASVSMIGRLVICSLAFLLPEIGFTRIGGDRNGAISQFKIGSQSESRCRQFIQWCGRSWMTSTKTEDKLYEFSEKELKRAANAHVTKCSTT